MPSSRASSGPETGAHSPAQLADAPRGSRSHPRVHRGLLRPSASPHDPRRQGARGLRNPCGKAGPSGSVTKPSTDSGQDHNSSRPKHLPNPQASITVAFRGPVDASTRKSPSRSGSPGRANALRKAGNASVARRKLHSSVTGAPVRWSKDTTRGLRQNAPPADTFKSVWRQGKTNMSANHCEGDSRAIRSAASVHAFNWPVRNQHRSCGAYARSTSRMPSEAGAAMNQHSHIRFDGS